jgi:hypothetical protein
MTEKEAIERGIIPRSEAIEKKNKAADVGPDTRFIRVPVEVTRYRKGFTVYHALWLIAGWFVGFMMGLRFH